MHLIDFIIGVIALNKLEIELAEVICLAGYILGHWRTETRRTKIWFPVIIVVLAFDVFGLHCQRPLWVCGVFNVPCVFGWLWLYEKLRHPLYRLAVTFLGFLVAVLR